MKERAERLLLVEDDPGVREQLQWFFDRYAVETAGDRQSALAQVRRIEPKVVVLDLGLPPDPDGIDEGMRALEEILHFAPHTKVIVITGNGDYDSAVRAIGLGAYDFYNKPIEPEILELVIDRAVRLFDLEEANRRLLATQSSMPVTGILGASAPIQAMCRLIERIAPTSVSVLVVGESGTGKELVARALHRLGGHSEGPFVAINCAAIPDTLLESELFGYVRGAFTGAVRDTAGKIEHARNGTLFLDEIGDMPLPLQAKLLRFLQERTIERIGGRHEIEVDTRIVCATNRNLEELMTEGKFRQDLYYRVSEVTIEVPPLRERDGDAVLLARAFLQRYSQEAGAKAKRLSDTAVRAIESYAWPGNVRELENKVRSAVVLSEGSQVQPGDLGLALDEAKGEIRLNLRQLREQVEREALQKALSLAGGNVSRAAGLLGVTRPTLYSLMNKYGVTLGDGD